MGRAKGRKKGSATLKHEQNYLAFSGETAFYFNIKDTPNIKSGRV